MVEIGRSDVGPQMFLLLFESYVDRLQSSSIRDSRSDVWVSTELRANIISRKLGANGTDHQSVQSWIGKTSYNNLDSVEALH